MHGCDGVRRERRLGMGGLKMDDFVIGVELTVMDDKGMELATLGAWALSDETMQLIIEDVADYMREDE